MTDTTTAGHTPGQWVAFKGVEEGDEFRCGVSAMRDGVGYLIATIENGAPGDFCDTEWANAKMMAASSAMFDALVRIATVDMGGGFLGALACRQVANEAIRLATVAGDDRATQQGGAS